MDGQVLGIQGHGEDRELRMEHVICDLRLRGAGNDKDLCSAGHGDEMWQMRLDYEGRDAEVGLVFIRDTSEKLDNFEEAVGAGRGGDVSVQKRGREVRRQKERVDG